MVMPLTFSLTLVLHQCSLFHLTLIILQLKILYGFARIQAVEAEKKVFLELVDFWSSVK